MREREWKERPNKHKYMNYIGELGRVVGIEQYRDKSGRVAYKVECAFCGEIHVRDAKHLKQGIKPRKDCKNVRASNYTGNDFECLRLRRIYGITLEEYNAMLFSQNGVCVICGNEEQVKLRGLSVDHCHKTGKVRGLLCSYCNMALGLFKDNINAMHSAINYLETNNAR